MKFLIKLIKDMFNSPVLNNEGGWVWAIPAAMAAYGAISGKQEEEAAIKRNKAAATQTEFSPWTKMGKGQLQSTGPGMLGGAVKGGLQGMAMMQGVNAMGAGGASGAAGGASAASAASQSAQPMQAAPTQVPMQAAQAPAPSQDIANTYVAAPSARNTMGQDWFNQAPQAPQQSPYNWGTGQMNNNALYASR